MLKYCPQAQPSNMGMYIYIYILNNNSFLLDLETAVISSNTSNW